MTKTLRKFILPTIGAWKCQLEGELNSIVFKSNRDSLVVAKRHVAINPIESYTEQDTREFLPQYLPTHIHPSFDFVFGAASIETKNVSELVAVIRAKAVIFLGMKDAGSGSCMVGDSVRTVGATNVSRSAI